MPDLNELKSIVGEDFLLTDPDRMESYRLDWSKGAWTARRRCATALHVPRQPPEASFA